MLIMRVATGAAALSMLLAATAACAQTAKRYGADEQRQRLAVASVATQRAALGTLAARGDVAALAQFGADATARAKTEPLEGEYLLAEWLVALRTLQPDAALRAQVEALTAHEAKALGPPPEPEHGAEWVPAFDVGSQARGTLRAWQLNARVGQVLAALASAQPDALPLGDAEALALAFARAPVAQIEALRGSASRMPSQPLAVLAKRLSEPALYRALFSRPADEFVVAAVADVAVALPADAAVAVLRAAQRNSELASVATLALSRLPGGIDSLFDCLADPAQGGSCAQALASTADSATVDALAAMVRRGEDNVATRRALLVLFNSGRDDARAHLAAYAADTRMPAKLRRRVNQWLQ